MSSDGTAPWDGEVPYLCALSAKEGLRRLAQATVPPLGEGGPYLYLSTSQLSPCVFRTPQKHWEPPLPVLEMGTICTPAMAVEQLHVCPCCCGKGWPASPAPPVCEPEACGYSMAIVGQSILSFLHLETEPVTQPLSLFMPASRGGGSCVPPHRNNMVRTQAGPLGPGLLASSLGDKKTNRPSVFNIEMFKSHDFLHGFPLGNTFLFSCTIQAGHVMPL